MTAAWKTSRSLEHILLYFLKLGCLAGDGLEPPPGHVTYWKCDFWQVTQCFQSVFDNWE